MSAWPGRRQPTPEERAELAAAIAESAQVTALCQVKTIEADSNLSKRSDLRKRNGMPRRRRVLDDPGERMRKLGIETGYDTRRNAFLAAPLEPWTSPHPYVGMRAYSDLMRGKQGADLVESWSGVELAELEWMRDEELVTISEDRLRVLPLSDERPRETRRYPGAPVPDELAAYGRQLRDLADPLIIEAIENLSAGKSAGRRPPRLRPGALTSAGIRLSAAEIAEEANRIKSRRSELDEYRYLGVETCRRRVRDLLKSGALEELEPPRAVREGRSWKTIARMFVLPPPGASSSDAHKRISAREKRMAPSSRGQSFHAPRVMAPP